MRPSLSFRLHWSLHIVDFLISTARQAATRCMFTKVFFKTKTLLKSPWNLCDYVKYHLRLKASVSMFFPVWCRFLRTTKHLFTDERGNLFLLLFTLFQNRNIKQKIPLGLIEEIFIVKLSSSLNFHPLNASFIYLFCFFWIKAKAQWRKGHKMMLTLLSHLMLVLWPFLPIVVLCIIIYNGSNFFYIVFFPFCCMQISRKFKTLLCATNDRRAHARWCILMMMLN